MPRFRNRAAPAAAMLAAVTLGGCIPIDLPIGSGDRATVKGSGVAVREAREVARFEEIEIGAAISAQVIVGAEQSVTVSADDNILPLVRTTVSNRRLTVDYASNTSVDPTTPVRIEIAVPGLRFVAAGGSAAVGVVGLADQDLEAVAGGASSLSLRGSARNLEVTASGASRVSATELHARLARVDASGASQVAVDAADSLDASASGASTVCYRREPGRLRKDTGGASSVAPCPSEHPW